MSTEQQIEQSIGILKNVTKGLALPLEGGQGVVTHTVLQTAIACVSETITNQAKEIESLKQAIKDEKPENVEPITKDKK